MTENIEKLKELYAQGSKHANYQILSGELAKIVGIDDIDVRTRYEGERLQYILRNISVNDKTVLDIGGNTGFFTFELIEHGAGLVHYYEGNETHADFVRLASKVLDVENKIEITNRYLLFERELVGKKYDITLLLNVLHHVGDDYGDQKISIEKAKQEIIQQINSLADKTCILIFQLGYCWKGNRYSGLFEHGTKTEMIHFIIEGTKDNWEVVKIGIAESVNNKIEYFDLNDKNISRNDSLGEFLNRPIFIFKSKHLMRLCKGLM